MSAQAGAWTPLFAGFEASPDATIALDGDAGIVFANAPAALMFESPGAALIGRPFADLLAADCRPWFRGVISRFFAAPRASDHDERHQRAGDHDLSALRGATLAFPIELALGRMSNAGASVAIVVIRDMTEARRAEAERATVAQEAHVRLEALFEFAPAFILAVSRDGKIEFINRILPQYRKADVIGSSWLHYFSPDRKVVMQLALEAVFAKGSTETFETTTPGPDGDARWFSTQIGPIHDGDKIVGAVLVSQDITVQKQTQAELVAARHMALLGTMAAGVAHEINTPIQFIGDSIGFLHDASNDLLGLITKLQALRNAATKGITVVQAVAAAAKAEDEADLPYLRENMPAAFERCVEGLGRVATIVRSLKEFAHPSEKDMRAVDLNHTIESTLTIARGEYKYVAELETDLGPLPLVTCHANEIGQAVLNIVVNAAHAIGDVVRGTDHRGVIAVGTRQEGDTVLISIRDTGGGIPEAIRGRIFDPFFTTKEIGAGTGQGLAIAWAKVKERHGGELSFETEVGKGTTFFIRLPIAGKTAPAALAAE